MKHNGFANILSWLASIVTLACIAGLVMAGAIFLEPAEERTQAAGLTFLVVTSWLLVLGLATLVVGAVSRFLSTGEASSAQDWRSRIAVLVGLVSLGIGLMFGVVFS